MEPAFEFISFMLGLLLGMIIMLLLVWIAYFTRSVMFAYCPSQAKYCSGADYYNNPADALAHGANINDILFINDQDQLLYKRVPRVSNCIPDAGQTVVIKYPQYCTFSDGQINSTWRQTAFNSNLYVSQDGIAGTLTTEGNCEPAPGQQPPMTSGSPQIKWDTAPIAD